MEGITQSEMHEELARLKEHINIFLVSPQSDVYKILLSNADGKHLGVYRKDNGTHLGDIEKDKDKFNLKYKLPLGEPFFTAPGEIS